jgi:hypothetical protein
MTTHSILAAVALSCGACLGAAGTPAGAEVPVAEGVYAYTEAQGVGAIWTIRTTCTPGCVAYVTTDPGLGFAAPLTNGRYSVTRVVPTGVTCPAIRIGDNGALFDGGTYPVTVRQSWDPLTLAGEVRFLDSPSPCGIPNPRDRFVLSKVG